MKQTIEVHIGERPQLVGYLMYNQEGQRESSAFEYAREWLQSSNCYSIDPTLPLVRGAHFQLRSSGSCFHPAIAESEPDGWGKRIIHRAITKHKRDRPGTALTGLDYLLAVSDRTRLGALRLKIDPSGQFLASNTEYPIPQLVQLSTLVSASHAIETQSDTDQDIQYLQGEGTSLGGMRPKCVVIDPAGTLWIAKFPSVTDERSVTQGEVLVMQLAHRAGIRVAEAKLVRSGKHKIALIKRFDRTSNTRIMFLSAQSMLAAQSTDDGIYTYCDIADIIRTYSRDTKKELLELWSRISFSILSSNYDDHLKNHGFLYLGEGKWELSPAYDINPFPDRTAELKTWISKESGPAASLDALRGVASYFGILKNEADAIIKRQREVVRSWKDLADSLGMTRSEIKQFEGAFDRDT